MYHVGKPLYHVGKSIYQVGKFDRKGWIRKLCFQRLFNKLSTVLRTYTYTIYKLICKLLECIKLQKLLSSCSFLHRQMHISTKSIANVKKTSSQS